MRVAFPAALALAVVAAVGCGSTSQPAQSGAGPAAVQTITVTTPPPAAAPPASTTPAPGPAKPSRPTRTSVAPTPSATAVAGQTRDPVAELRRPALLRSGPDGPVVGRLDTRTEFGSQRFLPIAQRRGDWLGVITSERPNGELGWIPADDTIPAVSRERIVVDLGARELRVRQDGHTLLHFTVGVGAPGTSTPVGRYAVTDGLRTPAGSPYGCCILALSGHQPHIAQGWEGGDRLAIHGTSDPGSIGAASSHGCLHATDEDLRRLMGVVGLGAIVEVRA